MSSRYSFTEEILAAFEVEYGIQVRDLVMPPSIADSSDSITLSKHQIHQIKHRLLESGHLPNINAILQSMMPSISMSLFVLNDATWKLMGKKQDHQDKMLPMTTIPWFYWDKDSHSKWGVKRYGDAISNASIDTARKVLTIEGDGGDFCGIIDRRAIAERYSQWRLVIPEFPNSSKMVPNYERARIKLSIDYGDGQITAFPNPRKDLDYSFSESPKVFYYHGLEIVVDGANTSLKVSNRQVTKLNGECRILIGRTSKIDTKLGSILGFHIWLDFLYGKLLEMS